MRIKNKYLVAIALMTAVIVMGLSNCKKHDQVLDLSTPPSELNTSILYSVKGTVTLQPISGSAWDGTIEAVWANAPKLTVHAVVPDLGNGTFTGFVGNATDITVRSLYDANNIYYLVEFDTPQKNVKSAQWYFDPTQTDMTKKWAQESEGPTLNSDGSTFRPPFQQDGFSFMFNISTASFNSLSCYAACHKNSSFGGPATTGGEMYTNGPNERLDLWRARMLQGVNLNQANDCFFDDGSAAGLGGTFNNLGLNDDPQANDGDGGFDNLQTLTITGTTQQEVVPLWVIPSATAGVNPYSNSVIMLKDTLSNGLAKKVVAVDSNGVLTLSGGATIDPRVGTDYKQVGSGDGPKCIPGSVVDAYTGSRGDITFNAHYTGSGWRMLFKRKLKTSDTVNDVDFSSLNDQPFGVAAFFNGADNEHAIVAGLTLHFKK